MSDVKPLKSHQPWKIYCFESSLKYVGNREAKATALTISLGYETIKEWYYLVKNQEPYTEDLLSKYSQCKICFET